MMHRNITGDMETEMKTEIPYRCSIAAKLAELPLSAADRQAAEVALRQGAFIADLLLRVATILRSATARIRRGFCGRARVLD
jgi:hypothetical protein